MALVLVISAIAVASVLGFALLSGATLETRTRGNAERSAQAEYLAESGINMAMYYLQNPTQAPALNAVGYWAGTGSDLAVGNGAVNVTVAQDSGNSSMYEVTSTGMVGDPGTTGDSRITRTQYARLNVESQYEVKYGTGMNSSTMAVGKSLDVIGDAICNGTVELNGGTITGTVYCKGWSYLSGSHGAWAGLPTGAVPSPTNNDINLYQTYASGGTTYSATQLGVTSLASQSLGASDGNPAGIWYVPGNLVLNNNVTIDGTLVVHGNLEINGANITINPISGYPGLVVTGDLTVEVPGKSMTVNGVCYVGGQLKASGLLGNSYLTINGGLLANGGIASSYYGLLYTVVTQVNYSASDPHIQVPDLSTAGRTPVAVKVVRWGPVVPAPY